ncbi:MAG: hypothetical protein ACK481_06530 [Candidatus Melainabacteria bacterium]|jgi:hypothetical protein
MNQSCINWKISYGTKTKRVIQINGNQTHQEKDSGAIKMVNYTIQNTRCSNPIEPRHTISDYMIFLRLIHIPNFLLKE